MPWLDAKKRREQEEEKRPERFRGKSDEEILKELQEAESFRKKFEESEAARSRDNEEVRKVTSQFEELKRELANAEANRNRQPAREPEELADFGIDPDKAFSQRVAPVAAATVANSAITARLLAQQILDNADLGTGGKQMDGRLFRAWSQEIDGESRKYQAAQLTSPQSWVGIFYYLKGLHAEELRDKETVKKKYGFLETVQAQSGEPPEKKPKTAEEELTAEEKHVADKMNVSYDNYLKRKKAMTFVQI